MSGGEQQMVAIGRALMSAPKLLLLDEPSLGLSPLMCGELFQALARVREAGVGILLVEQNAKQGLNIADRGYLIETGRIVGQGSAQLAARRSGGAARLSRHRRGSRRAGAAVSDAAPTRVTRQESAMKHVSLMIGDRDVIAADGRTFDRIDPFTGDVATRAAAASVARRDRGGRRGGRGVPGLVGARAERAARQAAQGRRPARRQGRRNSPR